MLRFRRLYFKAYSKMRNMYSIKIAESIDELQMKHVDELVEKILRLNMLESAKLASKLQVKVLI